MDLLPLLNMLSGVAPWTAMVLQILGALVVIGQVVVTLTPSTNDDIAWERIKGLPVVGPLVAALSHFAPIQKK